MTLDKAKMKTCKYFIEKCQRHTHHPSMLILTWKMETNDLYDFVSKIFSTAICHRIIFQTQTRCRIIGSTTGCLCVNKV